MGTTPDGTDPKLSRGTTMGQLMSTGPASTISFFGTETFATNHISPRVSQYVIISNSEYMYDSAASSALLLNPCDFDIVETEPLRQKNNKRR